MGFSFLAGVQLVLLGISAQGPRPAGPGDETGFLSSMSISPAGRWLVATVEDHRPFTPPGAPPGTRASQVVEQWVFRTSLDGASPQLLHRGAGQDVAQDGNSYETAVVLDSGTTLAMRGPVLSLWDPSGKKTEKKLPQIGPGFLALKAHPLGESALLMFDPLKDETPRELLYVLDLKALRLNRVPSVDGLQRYCLHWTDEGEHLFGVEAVPGKPEWKQAPDGTKTLNETYRLIRADLKGRKRPILADRVRPDGVCFGMTTIVWSSKKGNRKGVFLKAAMTPSREAQEVPALNDWEPVLALDGDRFLIRTFDWKRHRIVDLAAFDEKAFASESGDLPLPEYGSGIHYSPALGHLVLATLPFTVELADLKGNVRRKILLDRDVKGGKAAP